MQVDERAELRGRVLGDLAIMDLLMTVMADHSYDQADDPRYAGYVQTMLNDQKAAIEAANSDMTVKYHP